MIAEVLMLKRALYELFYEAVSVAKGACACRLFLLGLSVWGLSSGCRMKEHGTWLLLFSPQLAPC